MNEQSSKQVEFHIKEQVTVQSTKECDLVKKEAGKLDIQKSMPVKKNTHQVTPKHCVPVKRLEQTSEEPSSQHNKEAKACVLKQQERELEVNVSKQHRANVKTTDQINKAPTKQTADAKANQMEGGMINGAVKDEESALTNSHLTAEVSKQQSLHVSTAEGKAKGGSQVEVIRASVTPLPVGHLSPPIIKLEPLNVKGSCDEVQSMEVR